MAQANHDTTAPAPAAHPTTCALQADRSLIELCADWRVYRTQQLLIWAQSARRESLGDQNHEVDTEPLDMMKTLEDVLSRGRPKSMRGAVKMLEVAHTILTHEDPEAYMADGPVVEILRNVIRALEYCDAGEPIGKLRMELRKPHGDDGNGDVEESAGDVKASGSSGTASAISDHLDAIEDFAETLVVSVAPSVEMHDKVLGGSVHRLAREIVGRLEAIQALHSASPAVSTVL